MTRAPCPPTPVPAKTIRSLVAVAPVPPLEPWPPRSRVAPARTKVEPEVVPKGCATPRRTTPERMSMSPRKDGLPEPVEVSVVRPALSRTSVPEPA